jgi:hypothetical protein
MDCFRLRIRVASQFSVHGGERTNFILMNFKRFSSGNLCDIAELSEQDLQQTGMDIDSEDEFVSLAYSRKKERHAFRHDYLMFKFQNNIVAVQAACHPALNSFVTQSEGVDQHSLPVFIQRSPDIR